MRQFFTVTAAIIATLMLSTGQLVFAQDAAKRVGPQTIPCVPSLPCIQESTQESGEETRNYIINEFGATFTTGFLTLVGLASVIFIIVGGVQMHTAMGNEDGVATAKKTITWAVVGLVISMLSVAIVQIISRINIR